MRYLYGKSALVTGASSGIGREIAEALSNAGYHVYGTSRKPAKEPVQSGEMLGFLKMIAMDVRDERSIEAAVEKVLEAEGSIGVLINCAGIGIAGSVEDTSADEAIEQFDVNLFGALRVIRAVMPSMRQRRNGIIINIGSVAGSISIPFQSMYSASKAALSSLTSALRMETAPFGIKAVIIEPGDTKTGFTASRTYTRGAKENEAYRNAFERALYTMVKDEINGMPPESVANAVMSCLKRGNPPPKSAVGLQYKFLCLLNKLLPLRLQNAVVKGMYSGKLPKDAIWTFNKDVAGGNDNGSI
ncbi:MAG: SDR family oxidoreductase [Christensenellales bacterium]|jgi:short-subunit dehydrogenase